MIIALIVSIIFGLAGLLALWLAEQPATPPLSAARDNEPTPDEPNDTDRPTNPATRRGSGLTLAQIVAKAREDAETSAGGHPLYVIPTIEFAPEAPDEPVEDEPEPVEEEPVVVPAASGVETPPAPTPRPVEDFQRGKFLIQGPPTQRAALAAECKTVVSPFDESWMHTDMTGSFRLEDLEARLAAEQARHDAAALLTEVTA